MHKNALTRNFNYDLDQRSPVQVEKERVVKRTQDGQEIVSFETPDLFSHIKSHGNVRDWSLDALRKAGIDPSFPINTSLTTRLEGVETMGDFISAIEASIEADKTPKSE